MIVIYLHEAPPVCKPIMASIHRGSGKVDNSRSSSSKAGNGEAQLEDLDEQGNVWIVKELQNETLKLLQCPMFKSPKCVK